MQQPAVYVGLDYHDKQIQVCVLERSGKIVRNVSTRNDWAAVVQAVRAEPGTLVEVALEACTGSACLADELVDRAGWLVNLAHPGYVARLKQSPDKSDFSDARLLADLQRVGYVPRVWLAPEAVRELRRLVHYREGLVKQRRRLKQCIGAALRDQRLHNAPARPWTKRWLQWLRDEAALSPQSRWIVQQHLRQLAQRVQEVAQVDERLEQVTAGDVLVVRLMQQKGVGLITACILRALIGRFDRFHSGKQLARFCGASPRNASSGQRQSTGGLIDACDRYLRSVIIETAHRLKRFEPRWHAFAQSLRERGKPTCVVVAAVANRWLRALWHEMKVLGCGSC